MKLFIHNRCRFNSRPHMLIIHFILISLCILLIIGPVSPAKIILKTGEIIEGTISSVSKKKIQVIDYKTRKSLTIKRKDIKELIYGKNEKKILEKKDPPQKFIMKYKPRIGIMPRFVIPMGSMGTVLNNGLGGTIFGDFHIPTSFIKNNKWKLRCGLSIGISNLSTASSEISYSLTLLPILVYAGAYYSLENGFSPYVNFEIGCANVSMSGDAASASSLDATISFKAGTGYTYKNIPGIQFLLDFSYLIAFEKVNGTFLFISLGAAYKF